jgi:hypothetical protein
VQPLLVSLAALELLELVVLFPLSSSPLPPASLSPNGAAASLPHSTPHCKNNIRIISTKYNKNNINPKMLIHDTSKLI